MRILVNALQAGNLSGTGVYTRKLVEHMFDGCFDVDYVLIWPKDVAGPRMRVPVRMLVYYVPTGLPGVRAVKEQWTVSRMASKTRPSVVHYPASIGPWLPAVPSRSVLEKTVVTVHDLAYLKFPEKFTGGRRLYYRMAMVRGACRAAHVIADSENTRRDLVELAGVSEDRITVVHLGVDAALAPVEDSDELDRVREKYSLPNRFFLFVGTIEPRKNIDCIVDAFTEISGETDHDLVVAGRRGWGFGPLYERIEQTGLTDRIFMPGRIEDADLSAVYSLATAFVWPTLYEGFGLPPLESMACGTPVISSDIPVIREVAGDAAILVDPESSSELADAMRRISASDTLRAEMSGRGIERARMFPWDKTAARTMDVYRRVGNG